MKYIFKPKTKLEQFGAKIYNLLVDNFSHTYLVGGAVRDLLLRKKGLDVDLATEATPDQIIQTLNKHGIDFNANHKQFGIIIALDGRMSTEIATFRKEAYSNSRYPKIQFIKDPKQDSERRDFTVNSLYLSLKQQKIFDFHQGLVDLKNKKIKFIGSPAKRIKEDPLRIVRALRFSLALGFTLEKNTLQSIKKHFSEIKNLSQNRLNMELNKIKAQENKKIVLNSLTSPKLLDKFLLKS